MGVKKPRIAAAGKWGGERRRDLASDYAVEPTRSQNSTVRS